MEDFTVRQMAERAIPNCFTLTQDGLEYGLAVRALSSQHRSRLDWSVPVGDAFARLSHNNSPLVHSDTGERRVYRAGLIWHCNRHTECELGNVGDGKLAFSLLKVSLGNRRTQNEFEPTHRRFSFESLIGGDAVVRSRAEYLLGLQNGTVVNCLFGNEQAMRIRQVGHVIEAHAVSLEDHFSYRIVHALDQIERSKTIADLRQRRMALHFALTGVTDLLLLKNRAARSMLIDRFFNTIDDELFEIIWPRVKVILKEEDSTLLALVRNRRKVFAPVPERVFANAAAG